MRSTQGRPSFGLHLCNALDKVLVMDFNRVTTQRKHARLDAHRLELSAVEVVGAPPKLLKVDLVVHVHLARMDLQDACASLLCREGELNLAVDAARAQQRRVENVDAVGRGNDLDGCVG